MTSIVPEETRLAAKRGFVRTAAQSLATSFIIPAGVTLAFTGEALLAASIGVGGVVVGAVGNGLQSYFDIIARGIPGDYQPLETLPEDGLGDDGSDEVEFDDEALGLVEGPDHAAE